MGSKVWVSYEMGIKENNISLFKLRKLECNLFFFHINDHEKKFVDFDD